MANMPERPVLIDATSPKTAGRAAAGQGLIGHARFGQWHIRTFIAAPPTG
jgi:hypothetical protein